MPHLAHATMEPPAATARVSDGKCEVWASVQNAAGRARRPGEALQRADRQGHRARTCCSAAASAASPSPTSPAKRRSALEGMGGQPVKVIWTREDDLQHNFFHTVSVGALEAGLDAQRQAGGLAASHRGADHRLDLRAGPEPRGAVRAGMGAVDMPFAMPNFRVENPERRRTCASAGSARSPTSRTPSRSRASSTELARAAGKRSQGVSARPDRAAAPDRCARPCRTPWNYGEDPEALSVRHRAAARGDREGGERGGLGTQAAEGPRARHRRAPQLRQLRRGGRRGRRSAPRASSRSRASTSPSIAAPCQSRPRALADGGRRACMGIEPRDAWARSASRTAASSRPTSTASRSTRIDGAPTEIARHIVDTTGSTAAGRRRRARRAAGRAGAGQRDLRRHRQAHPQPADPRPARGEGVGGVSSPHLIFLSPARGRG